MSENSTSNPQTGMDKFFATLRGVGIRRRTDDKWIAGVCSGLADRLGVDPVIVRAALVLLSLLGGAGITLYLLAWALLPDDRDEIVAQRALRDGDGGSIVLVVLAAMALFGGSHFGGPWAWWAGDSGWGFPWGVALAGLFIWWLVQHSGNHPDADRGVSAHQAGTPVAGSVAPSSTSQPRPANQPVTPNQPMSPNQPVTPNRPIAKRPGRRSGGPLMALLAIGLALATYGSLSWAAGAFSWTGDHTAIAMAGALAATGLLLVILGLAGWRSGFVAFLAVVLAVTAWTTSAIPAGIHLGGQVGDAAWAPTAVAAASDYHLGVGNAVLDLSGLPAGGLPGVPTPASPPTIPADVGIGELRVVVPQDLTVKVVGHVSLGEIRLPADPPGSGQGGSDVSRSAVVGDGPPDVVVEAGVGIGQLTVVKE